MVVRARPWILRPGNAFTASFLRIAAHLHNREGDVDALQGALQDLRRFGLRRRIQEELEGKII